MAIQDVLGRLGQWSIKLRKDAPPSVVAGLEWFGHVAVVAGRLNPVEHGDYLLEKGVARYVGILRDVVVSTVDDSSQATLSGVHVTAWLGDEDGKGDAIEAPGITITAQTFPNAIRALLPAGGAVTEGTLFSGIVGTYSGSHVYQSPRAAIDYVAGLMDAEWRVNNDCTLDAGPASALYVTDPTAMIVRRDLAGYDHQFKALPGSLESTRSAKDFTSRVVIVAQALAGGTADIATNPFKDMHGNAVRMTRIVDETTDTVSTNAAARAQSTLNLWSGIRRALRLSATEFDIAGDFQAGDVVWCYDPDAGIADTDYEMEFRGRLIQPMPVRVRELSWPVTEGHTVAYRNSDGEWTDLTRWVEWESGQSEIVVSDSLSTALTPGAGGILTVVPGGGSGTGDTAIPDVPTFGTFTSTSYQPDDGLSRAAVKATWTQPLNTDASTIVDGDRYEVRYRPTGTTDWQVAMVAFDQTSATVTNLPPNTGFDWQIRCVDYASPQNFGAWSATTTFTTATDTTPPATPAAPTVAASLIAVQVTHTLGLASGGTYNLPLDMDHLEVHVGASAGYTPDATTRVGKIPVNAGMVTGSIPAVGSFDVSSTAAVYVKVIAVDKTGNRSTPSSAATTTAILIDNAHITDLTVSKLTSGTMTAAVILGGSIKTATSGARVEMDTAGVRLYNSGGTLTVDLNTATGEASIAGKFRTGLSGRRIEIDSTGNGTIYFYPVSGTDYAYINAPSANSCGVNSGNGGGATFTRLYATPTLVEMKHMNLDQSQNGGLLQLTSAGFYASGSNGGAAVNASATSAMLSAPGAGSWAQVTATAATAWAPTAGNASIQNGNGTYFSANGAGAYVSAPSGGEILVGVASGGTYIWQRTTNEMDIQGRNTLNLYADGDINASAPTIIIGTAGQTVAIGAATFNLSNITSATGVNLVHVSRRMYIASSARRFKVDIQPAVIDPADVLSLEPITYLDRSAVEENDGSTDGVRRHYGFVADDYADGALDTLVHRDDDGLPFSFAYDRVPVLHQVVLVDHEARTVALEAAVAVLSARLAVVEAA